MFTLVSVKNPIYTSADGNSIGCEVEFVEISGVHHFNACSWDSEPHGVALFNDLKAGKYGPIADYVPITIPKTTPNPNAPQPITTGTQTI